MAEEFFLKCGDEGEAVKQIREFIGAGDYEEVRARLPQFKCPSGRNIYYFPKTIEEYNSLKKAPRDILLDIGLRIWNEKDKKVHYLYPGEWYEYIPEGIEVSGIFGETEKFKKGITDDDIRFGCLPYGFIREEGGGE